MPLDQEPQDTSDVTYRALIGPNGQTSEILDRAEFVKLATCLHMSRFGNHEMEAITRAIYSCAGNRRSKRFPPSCNGCSSTLERTARRSRGYWPTRTSRRTNLDSDKEVDQLAAFLKVLRMRSWFSEWITLQVGNVAGPVILYRVRYY